MGEKKNTKKRNWYQEQKISDDIWLAMFDYNSDIGDNTPPSMKNVCPKDIQATADKFQIYTKVSWIVNDARDKRDGNLR